MVIYYGEENDITVKRMTLWEIAEECRLSNEEQRIFNEYTLNRFLDAEETDDRDMGFLAAWYRILEYASLYGADRAINEKVCARRPVDFKSPETVSIEIYESAAGKIPIILARDPEDFEQLVTNIAYKGIRPDNISTTGASFLSGPATRFIILSAKPYSNVPASELGLSDEVEWEAKSLLLRREHECTHYFTKQTYGVTNNILHDELMADFIGMYETFGYYKAEWFLRFMGVIEGSGNRLLFYTKDLPEKVRSAVSRLAEYSAYSLEMWSEEESFKKMTAGERIKYMCKAGFEGILENYQPSS